MVEGGIIEEEIPFSNTTKSLIVEVWSMKWER